MEEVTLERLLFLLMPKALAFVPMSTIRLYVILLKFLDCAHIEWFSEKLVDALKENDSRIAQLNTELETLKAKLTAKQEKLSAIDIKIAETEEKSKSLDITIREQQSLLNTIETLKKERYDIQKEIRTAEQSIRSLQSKLNNN